MFVCFINEVQRKILFSDVTETLHKRVLLVFGVAADTHFGYIKPGGVGGFESEGNNNVPVCAVAVWKSGSVLPGLCSFPPLRVRVVTQTYLCSHNLKLAISSVARWHADLFISSFAWERCLSSLFS